MAEVIVENLKDLNRALGNKKLKLVRFKPDKKKSFDLQSIKKAAESKKEFYIDFSEFAHASEKQKKHLFEKHFQLFKLAKKAGLEIKVLDKEKEIVFFSEFLEAKK